MSITVRFLRDTFVAGPPRGRQPLRPALVCVDGFSMSVQASDFHCCSPKQNGNVDYDKVEVGNPSYAESLLMPYIFDKNRPWATVYRDVPVSVVDQIIERHGGVLWTPNRKESDYEF